MKQLITLTCQCEWGKGVSNKVYQNRTFKMSLSAVASNNGIFAEDFLLKLVTLVKKNIRKGWIEENKCDT